MKYLLILFSLLLATNSWSQTTGTLSGDVIDDKGAGLPGANIRVAGDELSNPTGMVTDAQGTYTISLLPPGRYEVTVSFVGYETIVKMVSISAGRTTTANFTLSANVLWSDQIVVSASRGAEKVLDAPASVSVVSGDELASVPTLNVA